MDENRPWIWACRRRDTDCGARTQVMGILNVTPDSFSDGGHFLDPARAVARGLQLAEQGADIIDVGGESTRPGAGPVPVAEEIERTVRVIRDLRRKTEVLISVDTRKAAVASAALDAGADIINDVSALSDPGMPEAAARSGAGVILMHMRGTPETMQENPVYEDVAAEVRCALEQRMAFAVAKGLRQEQLVLDPGIGFGKTTEHNLALLNGIPLLAAAGRPVLIGASRKRFIGQLLGREPQERLAGSLAVAVFAALRGAHLLRVHDVKESCDALKLVAMMRAQREPCFEEGLSNPKRV